MPRSRIRGQSPVLMSPSPSPRESSPQPSSVFEDGDGDSVMTASRPPSMALMPLAPAATSPTSPPSLRDILSNKAPPPYTLGAFMAFLSQNHCLETLEFTMDADRYRAAHAEILQRPGGMSDANEHVCSLWQKLMHAYILPCGYREVNLPAHVRDRLLSLPATPMPPDPSELDEAVTIVYELMNDSVLGPFLASVASPSPEAMDEDEQEAKHVRSRIRIPKESSSLSSAEESTKSPKVGFLPLLNLSWTNDHNRSGSSSGEPTERETGLSDDTGSTGSPSGNEPMTPPTTPPTSDWAFSTSPSSLHRAISAHNNGWKKMGAKLGLSRKGRNKRPHNTSTTSAGSEPDVMPISSPPTTLAETTSHRSTSSTGTEETLKASMLTPDQSPVVRVIDTWEDPHPGQRFSCPPARDPGGCAGEHRVNGGLNKVGMAAKGFRPYGSRLRVPSSGNRQYSRSRLRPMSLKPLRIPSFTWHFAPMPRRDGPVGATRPERPISLEFVATTKRNSMLNEGTETDSTSRPVSCAIEALTSSDLASPHISVTDFSNHLNITFDDDFDMSGTRLDACPRDFQRSGASDEDPYGWEAELNRKLTCSAVDYQRTRESKRGILQRVFSLGPRSISST
ncbi:hypothetical protein QBC47DRAFT_428646 [Echria macrotheca]|uniref:RGS domain-containing protein n=1 Tax=Echria macrotheca TaxID=438768 RepID=A0AAJ0BN05_9PEZI|nr:hypothetical protein QBC47DRAFT_428646 [Echria macrotheca]